MAGRRRATGRPAGPRDVVAADDGRPAGPADQRRGRLFVVATPIGNLGDVTIRALEVLRSVPLVAAEDTRVTRRLFARYDIATRLISYREQNAPTQEPRLLAHLAAGEDLALVTDAGTPTVSDPGLGLVAGWVRAGGTVVPVPGASAALAALVASALPAPRWSFEGFLPRSGRDRRLRLGRIAADDRATVIFEAPGRVRTTLADLAASCGPGRAAVVCRELTKVHEEVLRGTLGDLARSVADSHVRGEVTIVVGGGEPGGVSTAPRGVPAGDADDPVEAALARVDGLVAGGLARGEAARRVAAESGVSRRMLYRPPESGPGRTG